LRHAFSCRPVTADVSRQINAGELSKLGAFRRPTQYPFRQLETHGDHIRLFSPNNRQRPPQIIAVEYRRITFGLKPYLTGPKLERFSGNPVDVRFARPILSAVEFLKQWGG